MHCMKCLRSFQHALPSFLILLLYLQWTSSQLNCVTMQKPRFSTLIRVFGCVYVPKLIINITGRQWIGLERTSVCLYRQLLICGCLWAFSHLLFSVCMLQCICVWERLLSLTFVYIISVASAEHYIDSSQSDSVLQSWGAQQCSGLLCMPRKPVLFSNTFTCIRMFEIRLEKMERDWNCVYLFIFFRPS